MASLYRIPVTNLLYINRTIFLKMPTHPETFSMFLKANMKPASLSLMSRYFSSKPNLDVNEVEDNSKPVKFSTSKASKWKAEYSRRGDSNDDIPPAQPYVVVGSTAALLIYFCVLREENDIDIKITGGTLRDPYLNLEEIQLKILVEENNKENIQTDPKVLNRLKELEEMKLKFA